ncbi:Hypothetical protein PHPALM_14063 [Phytophthora palmivora]|uniref:Uncharacterized protein n=1 Tax=Phytophthora palmivora TaxID=4796 RepID=A0A2P4XW08_9STRA|nr:Hypothetical protein PHPALM_14063 [Phytophthora palmivora]
MSWFYTMAYYAVKPCLTWSWLSFSHSDWVTKVSNRHVGFMRNKNVHLCPIGAVAFYLIEQMLMLMSPRHGGMNDGVWIQWRLFNRLRWFEKLVAHTLATLQSLDITI